MVNASQGLIWSFVGLALVLASMFVVAVHRATVSAPVTRHRAARDTAITAVATIAWLAATLLAARSGSLSFTNRPPTMVLALLTILAVAVWLGLSRVGGRLAAGIPLAALVGIQAFRFPLELMLHQAYVEGLMPIQMSFSGFNFDIISGTSAILVALVLARKPGAITLVRIWNAAGVVLLVNILVIAMLSAPLPFRMFHNEPANVWVTQAPWIWLPAVYVLLAITGHIVVHRRVRLEIAARSKPSGAPVSAATAA